MDAYLWLKYGHVLAAVIWVGGGFVLFLLHARMARARDFAALESFTRHLEAVGMRLFMPASIAVLGFGLWMVAITPAIGFTDLWIIFGYGGIVVSVALGAGVSEPTSKRLATALETEGPESVAYRSALRRINTASVAEFAVMFFVIWAMVAKPTL